MAPDKEDHVRYLPSMSSIEVEPATSSSSVLRNMGSSLKVPANPPKVTPPGGPPSEVEHIKRGSEYLRGTIYDALRDRITGSIPEDDNRLLKFHGSYMQDDRDQRNEREKRSLNQPISSCCVCLPPEVWPHQNNIWCWITLLVCTATIRCV